MLSWNLMAGPQGPGRHWEISFALQPDLQFKFELASHLHKTVAEIKEMDGVEYIWWQVYFERQQQAQESAQAAAERRRSR